MVAPPMSPIWDADRHARAVYDTLRTPVYLLDAAGRVLWCNRAGVEDMVWSPAFFPVELPVETDTQR